MSIYAEVKEAIESVNAATEWKHEWGLGKTEAVIDLGNGGFSLAIGLTYLGDGKMKQFANLNCPMPAGKDISLEWSNDPQELIGRAADATKIFFDSCYEKASNGIRNGHK